jgi:hypothetical protein
MQVEHMVDGGDVFEGIDLLSAEIEATLLSKLAALAPLTPPDNAGERAKVHPWVIQIIDIIRGTLDNEHYRFFVEQPILPLPAMPDIVATRIWEAYPNLLNVAIMFEVRTPFPWKCQPQFSNS